MSMFSFRRTPPPPTPEERLATIRLHSRNAEEAIQLRNRAISDTRGHRGVTLEEVAQAAGLTVSRVKQIRGSEEFRGSDRASGPPITDLDLPVLDADSSNRVWGITDIAPDIPTFESERAFLATGRGRYGPDLGWDYYDVDRGQRFVISSARSPEGGIDIYAFGAGGATDKPHSEEGFRGSSSGPCYLLGNVKSTQIADKLLFPALIRAAHRPGSLAWAYMRIRTITEVLDSAEKVADADWTRER